jgi:site-specific DNA recombinase
MDAQFSRDLVVAVKRGMQSKAERGWLPGVPPIGYKNYRDEEDSRYKTIILDEKRIPIIRKMWDMM